MKQKDNPSDRSSNGPLAKVKAVVPPVASRFKKQTLQQQTAEALENLPRITNETVAEHREEVLKGARKYKYPLSHSKHKIIIISAVLLFVVFVASLTTAIVNLYKMQSTSSAMYRVTQIVPFPVAKVGKDYVAYENYLFELRRYMYYYRTQQQVDFSSESGKRQLELYKPRAMDSIVQDVYVKQLAAKNDISVSDGEVDDAVKMLRTQNRLASNKELASVIRRFYNWSIGDLERELRQELLAQKVAAKLDTAAAGKAADVLQQAKNGADFAALAKQYSDDTSTKEGGGQYADTAITISSQEVPVVVVRELAKMKPGEVSNVITSSTSFEIVKLLSVDETGKYKAAHIQVNFRPVDDFTKDAAAKTKVTYYIDVKK